MGRQTPKIDRLAREGMRFTDYYAEQSCTAGRAAFITGQSPMRTGLTKVGLPGAPEGMKKEDPTIAGLLNGTIVVEVIFNYPGIGSAAAAAALRRSLRAFLRRCRRRRRSPLRGMRRVGAPEPPPVRCRSPLRGGRRRSRGDTVAERSAAHRRSARVRTSRSDGLAPSHRVSAPRRTR